MPIKQAGSSGGHGKDIGLVKPMEELVPSTTTAAVTTAAPMAGAAASNSSRAPQVMERTRVRPQKEQALNCPRCNSTNTKFCYYNNYSLTQPRYFCKTCRRYWTEGGSLRNVPVGGGSRKNKRSSSLSASAAAAATNSTPISTSSSSAAAAAAVAVASVAISNASKKLGTDHHLIPPAISLSTTPSQAPNFHEGQDLNLAFPHHSLPVEFNDFANLESASTTNNNSSCNSNRSNPVSALSAMELLRNGMAGRSLGQFMQMPMAMPEYPAGFELQEFRRPPLSFPLDGISAGDGAGTAAGYGSMQGVQESDGGGRMLFPFEDLKPVVPSSTAPDQFEQSRVQGGDHSGFWNGMIGGGGSW